MGMNCPDFDTLMMLLDGELRGRKLKEVSEHVLSCSRCRGLIDSQRMLEASWRDNIVIPDSEKFRSMEWNIFRKINRRSHWRTFVPAVAAIIVVLLGVKLILTDGPSMDRITDLSRDDQAGYTSESEPLSEERTESLISAVEEPDSEVATGRVTVISGQSISAGDAVSEITGEVEDFILTEGGAALSQAAEQEEDSGESLRGGSSPAPGMDRQDIADGNLTESVSGGSGSIGFDGIDDEHEELETPHETLPTGTVEDSGVEEQMDIISDITLSLDNDTMGLEIAESVSSITLTCDEMQDNRVSPQSSEYYLSFHETSDLGVAYWKSDIVVELVFDADGQPDSITALLLDSLFAGWSDYILSGYRDTVLVIPLADIQKLFMDGSTVPTETIE